ncbi:MAG: GTP-binding protein [Rhodospirillaceae bacterium]|nr:GTP-binding protein [Rhodospirillaceae bacterium]
MPQRPPEELIPVTVITGFLGSGKTTVLSHLLGQPAFANTAVVINEFGEISLDHALVEKTSEDIVELRGGCLCCSARGDVLSALQDLYRRRKHGMVSPFARLVIETTGLADPAPILHTLMRDRLIVAVYRLDGVVTTVDCVNGAPTLAAHEEAVKQVAVADRLLLTKTDLAAPADVDALRVQLRALNPGAAMDVIERGRAEPSMLFDIGLYDMESKSPEVGRWLREEAFAEQGKVGGHDRHGHDVNRHDDSIGAYCVTRDEPVNEAAFSYFLEALIAGRGADLLRVKGIVNVAERPGRPAVIHGVQHLFHPVQWLEAWPDDDRRTRIVFITQDIAKAQIETFLDALHASEPPPPST